MTQTGAAAAPSPSEMPPERRPSAAEAPPSAVQLTVSVPDDDTEVLAAVVWGGVAGSVPPPDGVEERDTPDGAVRWVISWVDPPSPDQLALLSGELRRCGATIVGTASVATDEGLDAWRDHASVWRAGPFAVRPPWLEAIPDAETVDLVIDPGATFGSGSHQSTRMALELLANLPIDGTAVVDVGSGSGILGIGAALLGAARVDLVELDPRGEDVGLTNAFRNRVADRVRWAGTDATALAGVRTGPAQHEPRVVAANMLIGELEAVAPSLRALAGTGGLVIAAGVLESQVPRLMQALGAHRRVDCRIEPSETDPSVSWAALALELQPAPDPEADDVDPRTPR
jgi:ribosomal protein L11 methyltransferase